MSRKVMRLINPYNGEMECKICGAIHYAMIRPGSGGHYYRGAWQCHNGCRFEDLEDYQMADGIVVQYTIKNAKGELATIKRP